MADRILDALLGSWPHRLNAGHPFHPRDRLDPDFRALVEKIYALMTQPGRPGETGDPRNRGRDRPWACPPARIDQLARRHARGDRRSALRRKSGPAAYRRTRCSSESTDLFRSARPCNCCAWRSSRSDVELTALGRRFVDMDIGQRTKCMGDQVLAPCRLLPISSASSTSARPTVRPPPVSPRGWRLCVRGLCRNGPSGDHQSRPLRRVLCPMTKTARRSAMRIRNSRCCGSPARLVLTCLQ